MSDHGVVEEKLKISRDDQRIARSAGVVGIAVLFSRIFGLLREVTFVHFFQAKLALDAFYAAYRIPNLLRDLFAEGDLSKAFISIFTDVDSKNGQNSAWYLANVVFNAVGITLTVLTILGIVFSPAIVDAFFVGKGFDTPLPDDSSFGFTNKRDLTVHLTKIMFPFIIMVSLSAISMGMLNTKGHFAIPAFAPTLFNVSSIVFAILGYRYAPSLGQHPVIGAAVGVIVGGLLQFIVQIPSMFRIGFRYRPVVNFTDPGLRCIVILTLPAIVSSATMQISVYINSVFASQFDGWLSWVTLAFRILYMAVGILGVSLSTATLPVLSRHISEGDVERYCSAFLYSIKLMFALTMPASALLISLSKPIVTIIYKHGVFTENDAHQVAGALICYSLGLCGYSGFKIARDGFYAIKNIKIPVFISVITVCLNAISNYVLIFRLNFDHRSLALSTSFSITMNFILLMLFLKRKVKSLQFSGLELTFAKSLIGAVIAGLSSKLIHHLLSALIGNFVALMISMSLSCLFIYLAYRALKLNEFNQITSAIINKVGKIGNFLISS